MKFYVAAKWELKEQVEDIYKKIKARGHEITEDWTKHDVKKPYGGDIENSRKFSLLDVKGTRASDVFVLLTDKDGIGMYVEFGIAIMSYIVNKKPRVYVIGSNLERSVHFFHPHVRRKKTIEEVLDEVGN